MHFQKEKLIQLVQKAHNIRLPALYREKENGWVQTYLPVFGLGSKSPLKQMNAALNENNIDPLLHFTRRLNKTIKQLEKQKKSLPVI